MISLKSAITKKVLSYFLMNSSDDLYVNEMVEKLNVDKRNLVKKLKELTDEGLLNLASRGNLKLYSLNKKYPLLGETKGIIEKTAGFEIALTKLLKTVKGIEKVYIYGSFARNAMTASSDVDILAVGSHKIVDLQRQVNRLQKQFGREINVVNMDIADYRRRVKTKDPFIKEVLNNKNIKVV